MTAELVDPLTLPQWDFWIKKFPGAHFFHGRGWARVLHETYRHRPIYPCWLNGEGIQGTLPLMEVASPFMGRRGVSLPFTDFSVSLRDRESEGRSLYEAAVAEGKRRKWRYLECRSSDDGWPGSSPSLSFWGHAIDLTVGVERLFKGLDSAVRRGLRKGQKSGLTVEFLTDAQAMETYYGLHCKTRQRHGLPPQPHRFFQKIQQHLLTPGNGSVGIVRHKGKSVAGAIYLWLGRQAFYKFGASDYEAQQLRPNNVLMWAAMEKVATEGFESLHLGRTSLFHEGLRRFKLGFGAIEKRLTFCKFNFARNKFVTDEDKVEGWFNRIFMNLPQPILRLAGRMLYPHLS